MIIRIIGLLIAASLVALGFWSMSHRGRSRRPPPTNTAPAPVGADQPVSAPRGKPAVTIQDGKTIDFSTGHPEIKDDAANKAALEHSINDMDAAAGNVTFTAKPTPKTPPPPAK